MSNRDNWREELKSRYLPLHDVEVTVRDGWKDLICDLVEKLDATGLNWKIKQVKEKFGALRFYTEIEKGPSLMFILSFTDYQAKLEEFNTLVEEAEDRSYHICETCGKAGFQMTIGSLLQVLCKSCGQDAEIERREKKRTKKRLEKS